MLPRFSLYGGVEQFGYRLSAELAARGHQVDFICARKEVEAPAGVNIITTGRPCGPRALKMLSFMLKADTLLEKGHYNCSIGLGKTLHQDILRVGGGPLQEFWNYSEQAIPSSSKRLLKKLRRRLNPFGLMTKRLEKKQFEAGESQKAKPTKIVAVSDFVRDLIIKSHPELQKDDIEVIYNRPDLERFSPPDKEQAKAAREQFGIADGVIAIGLATSNLELKGTGPMIRALTGLPPEYHLYIASARKHATYDKLAKSLGVESRVHFLGKVDQMPEFYRALDIFALPSFYDACSNAALEAMASGLPVLSTTANGSSCFLPAENVVQNPGNSAELAETLLRLGSNSGKIFYSTTRTPFVWPENKKAGIDEFVALVEQTAKKNI